jgi:hypothetical protein
MTQGWGSLLRLFRAPTQAHVHGMPCTPNPSMRPPYSRSLLRLKSSLLRLKSSLLRLKSSLLRL